jgi:hypothetical protein
MQDQIFDDKTLTELPVSFSRPPTLWDKILNNKSLFVGIFVFLLIIVGISWYFLSRPKDAKPVSSNVILTIKGPTELTSGNEGEYRIVYRNGENADLVGVTLEVLYPTGFKYKSSTPIPVSSSGQTFNLPALKPGADGEVIVRGKLLGSTGEDKQIKANLHYRLSNFNSEFRVEQSLMTRILPPNLTMDINGPVDVVNGQDTTFTVTFTNVSTQDFSNLGLQMSFPEGYAFSSANPAPSKPNYWTIASLPINSSTSIEITGSFSGDTAATKLVRADLGQQINGSLAPQINSTATFKLIPSSLALTLTSQSSDQQKSTTYTRLGDTINFKLKYANQGNIGLNNINIIVNLSGPALDLTRLNAQNAIVTGNTLTWKTASFAKLSVLSPNETGEISFSVPVKTSLSTNLKNQTIGATAQISSDEITKPTKSVPLSLKLLSKLDLAVTGEYVSGAAPMEVGQPTLFAMTFTLSNLSNDLSNTTVVASMPLPVSAWKNVVIPDSEKSRLTFDPNSGKILWNVGQLPAFTGKFLPALKATFQLEITPTEFDRQKTMNLLANVQAMGTDTFVDQAIQTPMIASVTTGTIDDDVLNVKGTTVK